MDMAQWANCMLSWNALPPDPAIAGAGWREQWRERLERTPNFVEAWLSHQLRDDYWRHGSACESYAAIRCPVMAIGGWTDGYTDAVFRLLEHLDVPRRGLIGPWGHNDPGARRARAGRRLARRMRALLRPLAQGHRRTGSTTSRC